MSSPLNPNRPRCGLQTYQEHFNREYQKCMNEQDPYGQMDGIAAGEMQCLVKAGFEAKSLADSCGPNYRPKDYMECPWLK